LTSAEHVPRPPWALALTGVVLACAFALPAVYLVILVAGSADVALGALWRDRTLELLLRSVGLAAAVTASAVLIAIPAAWLTARTDLPGRRFWAVALALPLVIPSYIGAYTYVAALGPRGMLQDGLAGSLGIERLPDITGFFGAWLVLTLFTFPLVMLPVRATLQRADPSLEEAATGMGRSPLEVFRTVVFPQLNPSVWAGSVLVALYVLSDFGAVSIMRFRSFTLDIHTAYGATFDRTGAATLALVLVALMLLILWSGGRLQRGRVLHRSGPGATRPPVVHRLGRWRMPALAFCGSIVLVALVIPVAVLVRWSTTAASGSADWQRVAEASLNSVSTAGVTAAIAALCAFPVAYLAIRYRGRLSQATENLSFTSYAMPGIVVALSLVFFGTRVFPALYQTRTMLIFAFVILFVPLAIIAIRSSLMQVSPRLTEVARGFGRSPSAAFVTVTLPLTRVGVVTAAALVGLTALKELPATLILAPIGFSTLATEVWQSSRVAFFEQAAIPSLVLLLVSAVPLYLLLGRAQWQR
jgi:iron(III) transport system permease protein